jgi:hypothetical protein
VTYRRVLNWTIGFIDNSELQAITVLSLIYTLRSSPLHMHYGSQSSLVVSWQRIYNRHCHFKSHVKSSFHSLIPFLPLFCSCQFRRLDSIQFLCSQAHTTAGWHIETRLTSLNWTLLYNHFERTTQKTQLLYCWEGMFTAPLPSNRRPIAARVGSRRNVFTESLPSNGPIPQYVQ